MNQSLFFLWHKILSFVLRTASVYVEPLLQPRHKPDSKRLADPISAVDLLHNWSGLHGKDLALLIEHELKRTDGAAAFARPYLRIPNTRAVCPAGPKFKEDAYSPTTTVPHVIFKNGRKLFDFSRILFDKEDLASFATRFRLVDEVLVPRKVSKPTLKSGDNKILAELAAIRADLTKRDSKILLKYLPIARELFEQEFEKFPIKKLKYQKDEYELFPVKIKKEEFLKKMKNAAPDLPASAYLEFWKLLPPICKLSGRDGDPE